VMLRACCDLEDGGRALQAAATSALTPALALSPTSARKRGSRQLHSFSSEESFGGSSGSGSGTEGGTEGGGRSPRRERDLDSIDPCLVELQEQTRRTWSFDCAYSSLISSSPVCSPDADIEVFGLSPNPGLDSDLELGDVGGLPLPEVPVLQGKQVCIPHLDMTPGSSLTLPVTPAGFGGTPSLDRDRWRELGQNIGHNIRKAMADQSTLPLRIRALGASSARDISVAARVHKGATVAVVLPPSMRPPKEPQLLTCGLSQPSDMKGWYRLTDGSCMGLLQLDARALSLDKVGDDDTTWGNHGQARALHHTQVRTVKFLERYLPNEHAAELRNSPQNDYNDVLHRLLPGVRLWPLSDVLVSRVIAWNVASERCRSVTSSVRLDRGARFLDLARLHYGEEVAFLFAWHSHYLYTLAAFVVLTIPFIILRTSEGRGYIDRSMFPNSALTIVFGVLVTGLWDRRVKHLVHRWHVHGDSTTRWHHLVLNLLASAAKVDVSSEGASAGAASSGTGAVAAVGTPRSKGRAEVASLEEAVCDAGTGGGASSFGSRLSWRAGSAGVMQLEQSAMTACRSAVGWESRVQRSWHGRLKRILKAGIIIPMILVEWACILLFFTIIVWFEVWLIFDWGGCREFNLRSESEDWGCMSADQLRGIPGLIIGALPSICEGVFFELLLVISKFSARSLISLYDFSTREQSDFAVVLMVFIFEVVGKVGFISVLGLGFVPAWKTGHWTECYDNWDYLIFGDWSLGCLKGQIPFNVRLKLFESCMKGPMLVSGLIGILLKTLLPILLEWWRRGLVRSRICRCRRYRVVRCLLMPTDFILRVCLLIFQVDARAVGGPRLLCEWPASMDDDVNDCRGPSPASSGGRSPISFQGFGGEGSDTVAAAKTAAAEERARVKRSRLQDVLLEGDRREHEPFDEYIELLLHFLWTSCFAIVWPLGTVLSLLNQFLEVRFDCMKLLVVRRRRFPSSRHMSVAWVPRCALIVCHISIVVNISLLLLPYRQLLMWFPQGCTADLAISTTSQGLSSCTLPKIGGAFLVTWVIFLLIRWALKFLLDCLLNNRYRIRGFCRRSCARLLGGPAGGSGACCGWTFGMLGGCLAKCCDESSREAACCSSKCSPRGTGSAAADGPDCGSPEGSSPTVRLKLPSSTPPLPSREGRSVDSLGMRRPDGMAPRVLHGPVVPRPGPGGGGRFGSGGG